MPSRFIQRATRPPWGTEAPSPTAYLIASQRIVKSRPTVLSGDLHRRSKLRRRPRPESVQVRGGPIVPDLSPFARAKTLHSCTLRSRSFTLTVSIRGATLRPSTGSQPRRNERRPSAVARGNQGRSALFPAQHRRSFGSRDPPDRWAHGPRLSDSAGGRAGGRRKRATCSISPTEKGVPCERLDALGREIRVISDIRALWGLYRVIRDFRPSVVHTHAAKAGLLGRLAARLAGVPVVVHTYHGHVLRGYFGPVKTAVFRELEALLGRFSDALIAVSEAVKQDLAALGVARCRAHPGGAPRTRPRALHPRPAPRGLARRHRLRRGRAARRHGGPARSHQGRAHLPARRGPRARGPARRPLRPRGRRRGA